MFADVVYIRLSEIRKSTTFDLNPESPVYFLCAAEQAE